MLSEAPKAQNRRAGLAWWLAFVLGGTILFLHFAAIEMSNLPTNPLTFQVGPLASNYVHPLFTQNWNFFAPHPVSEDMLLYIRGQTMDGRNTSWVDVSTPLTAELRHNLFSPNAVTQLGVSNILVAYDNSIGQDSHAYMVIHGKRYWKPMIPTSVDPFYLDLMTRVATAALDNVYPHRHFRRVQLGIGSIEFPRFSLRANPDSAGRHHFTPIGWQSAPSVTAICCSVW